ncbi:MAG TPA: hypothetical protein VEC14_05630, partial [Reyranellaceae bacterium]|nr:hypothetical protein [Reyranellaceae bacterium]
MSAEPNGVLFLIRGTTTPLLMQVTELTSIGVIAGATTIEPLAKALREAAGWSLIPIEWPDVAA